MHKAKPWPDRRRRYQRDDGLWVYRKVRARDLWDQVMRSTYDHAEPGILFLDRMNRDNNLQLLRDDRGHQSLRRAAAAALRLLLPRLDRPDAVRHATRSPRRRRSTSTHSASVVATSIRMLDNVLDVTAWPLEQQRKEAMAKRRVGLGFTGLGDALIMLRLRTTPTKRARWRRASRKRMRDHAYLASVELAKERGAFPLFNADLYLSGTSFASRLPDDDQGRDPQARHPQLAPAVDRAHRHHQPRLRRQRLQRHRAAVLVDLHAQEAHGRRHAARSSAVEDHAWRLYRRLGGDVDASCRPTSSPRWRSAPHAHEQMVAAVAPFIDTSISKTVNVPEDYPYAEFQDLYFQAWKSGLKGLATYRPNKVLGSVLSVADSAPQDVRARTTSTAASR